MNFELENKKNEKINFKADNVGEWVLDPKQCIGGSLPEKLASAFYKLFHDTEGVRYIPLIYCGYQLVNGTNYMIICKATYTTNPLGTGVVKIILNETLPCCGIFGVFSVLSIETIVEETQFGGYKLMPFIYVPGELTKDPIKKAFEEATKDFDGSLINPLVFCGTQIVSNSINHMYICTIKPTIPKSNEHLVMLVLNQDGDEFILLPNISLIV